MENEAVVAVAQASVILFLKMWLCGTITTYVRGKTMESPNKEDGFVMNFFNRVFFVPTGELKTLPGNDERDARVNRWIRICANDTANIPVGLFVLYLAAVYGALAPGTLVVLTWIFVGARLAHTAFYAAALQPFRTASYATGSTSVLVAAGYLFALTVS